MEQIRERCSEFSDCRHVGYRRPDSGSRVYAFRDDNSLAAVGEILLLDALGSLVFGEDQWPQARKDTIINVVAGGLVLDYDHSISMEQDPENCKSMRAAAAENAPE